MSLESQNKYKEINLSLVLVSLKTWKMLIRMKNGYLGWNSEVGFMTGYLRPAGCGPPGHVPGVGDHLLLVGDTLALLLLQRLQLLPVFLQLPYNIIGQFSENVAFLVDLFFSQAQLKVFVFS